MTSEGSDDVIIVTSEGSNEVVMVTSEGSNDVAIDMISYCALSENVAIEILAKEKWNQLKYSF